ncbi:50S ribosomal protein L31e [Picrophilus oshimae]|uniref:Large ribosomal subunit protein eL31 n=1 Tax=Picrophilus torridus (strain ATCC 700027 / DSM 9790 / JCM 10055 / NBRC 100828 / KAW 2/3) TaxID=1122961 RepID=RL31_PICTO|nr:50S ribosomal protein L31e [Picrophilus oshimae]Q6L2L1.1 RecName: Full=Large ribosomal subunit protein eL31; AltName: Full=50S ribosomal protein L31e [Picrophilus oshimae DSM 9789]AAT42791.1 large subunit ribosomal protein L31E [Picrophilus oshimae DSM 9789]
MADEENTTEILLSVSLRKARFSSKSRRADTSIKMLKDAVARYTKSDRDRIWVDNKVNELIWSRGRRKVPTRVNIKVIKLEDGTSEIILP